MPSLACPSPPPAARPPLPTQNIATNQPAGQSSTSNNTGPGFSASAAVDDNTDGNCTVTPCAITGGDDENPFWCASRCRHLVPDHADGDAGRCAAVWRVGARAASLLCRWVDVGQDSAVQQIVIYNRIDCCAFQLQYLIARLSDSVPSPPVPGALLTAGSLCGMFAGSAAGVPDVQVLARAVALVVMVGCVCVSGWVSCCGEGKGDEQATCNLTCVGCAGRHDHHVPRGGAVSLPPAPQLCFRGPRPAVHGAAGGPGAPCCAGRPPRPRATHTRPLLEACRAHTQVLGQTYTRPTSPSPPPPKPRPPPRYERVAEPRHAAERLLGRCAPLASCADP